MALVIAAVSLEVLSIAWLYLEDGRYTPAFDLYQRTSNIYVRDITSGSDCRFIETLYPHPYLAFVHHGNPPCGIPWINDIGLFGADMPTVRPDDRFVVLLTGGSVAAILGGNQPPPSPNYLQEALARGYQSPNGQPWLVLNGAAGAWKEPQPFIISALYAGSVHAIVSLGGFNEHYYFQPDFEQRLESPASNFLLANPYVADENFGDAAIAWFMGRIAGRMALNPVLRHSHAGYVIVRAIEAAAHGRENLGSDKRTSIHNIFLIPKDLDHDPSRKFDFQLALYQKYWRGTHAMAADMGISSAFFLQPVPAWGKHLTEQERLVVGDLSYRDLYRHLVGSMGDLKDRGLQVFDLGEVFMERGETIYADQVHFVMAADGTSLGNRLVAEAIAGSLAVAWGLKPLGH